MPEGPNVASQRGRLGRGWRPIAEYEPVSTRDHWVDAVIEKGDATAPAWRCWDSACRSGMHVLGAVVHIVGDCGCLVCGETRCPHVAKSTAEWRKACAQDRVPSSDD